TSWPRRWFPSPTRRTSLPEDGHRGSRDDAFSSSSCCWADSLYRRGAQRQLDADRRPLAQRGFYRHGPAEAPDHSIDDRQAEARGLALACGVGVRTEELVEEVRKVRGVGSDDQRLGDIEVHRYLTRISLDSAK